MLAVVPRDAVILAERSRLLADAIVFVLCIPLAYVLDDNAPWLLLLLAVSGRAAPLLARRSGGGDTAAA